MGLGDYVKTTYDKKLRATNDTIVIRKLEKYNDTNKLHGGVALPASFSMNCNLTKGRVESVGPKAKAEGIEPGMVVLYDHFAGFYLTDPIICVAVENVIGVYNE